MSDGQTMSSYLRYLPPVLWAGDFPLPGQMLRVFEKLLTGIDDGQIIQHGDHTYQAIEEVIDRLDQLFDPWHTPPQFLDWLASWVDLTFPTRQNLQQGQTVQVWDEYLRRKAIAQIAQIYHRGGLKEGMNLYLNLYTLADKRPRIAIDDGSRILSVRPQPGRFAQVATLLGRGPYPNPDPKNPKIILDGIVSPSCIALAPDPDGSLIVGDVGAPTSWTPTISSGLWRVFPSGQPMLDATTGRPQRISPTATFFGPLAVVTDNTTPWQIYMLDNVRSTNIGGTANALYQISSQNFATATAIATKGTLGLKFPIAMVFSNGHLLILDRGQQPDVASAPAIIDVTLSPLQVSSRRLTTVSEPLSMIILPNGNLLIGDGRQQTAAQPADVVLVDRSNNASWVETSLLSLANPNPLIAPVGIVRQDDTHLFAVDLGLKGSLSPPASERAMAEAAAIYAINLQQSPPGITRASEQGTLVHPAGMLQNAQGTLYIVDQGEQGTSTRAWRATPHEFGVVVHFSSQRHTTTTEQNQIRQNINDIINQEKPAHTFMTMF